MESKYYAPNWKDLFVDMELEAQFAFRDGSGDMAWSNTILRGPENFRYLYQFTHPETLDFDIAKVRVKYLDREDIESLGFESTTDSYFRQGKWSLKLLEGYNVVIGTNLPGLFHLRFQGTIKNKSELQRVLKMLGI